jgi:hypothetical protein
VHQQPLHYGLLIDQNKKHQYIQDVITRILELLDVPAKVNEKNLIFDFFSYLLNDKIKEK